jgi:lambda family phage portal protein
MADSIASPWYEPLIARHLPGLASRRAAARLASQRIGVLASLKGGIPNRSSEGFGSATGFTFDTAGDRRLFNTARDRARSAFQNNPVARSLVQTETDNVVAEGFTLQARTDSAEFNKEAEERFADWFDRADVTGMRSASKLQRDVWSQGRVDGYIGVALVDRGESRLQLIPSDWLQTPDDKLGQRYYHDGVQTNEVGRPIAFHVLDADEWGKRKFTEIPADSFLYLAHTVRSGQVLGETCYATVFETLNHLDQYIDGVALAAWMATVFGLIFKEANPGGTYAGLTSDLLNSKGALQKAVTLENGSVKFTGPADSTVQVDAKQPMQQTPDFVRMLLRLIGQPFDMPLEILFKDVSQANLSSLRGGRQDYHRACRPKQLHFRHRVLTPIYRWWVSREVKIGGGTGRNDRFVSAVPELYQTHEWRPRGWENTDPISDAQGKLLEIDAGFNSPQNVCAELGRDFESIQKQIAEATKMREGLDLHTARSTYTRDEVVPAAPMPEPGDNKDTNEPNP